MHTQMLLRFVVRRQDPESRSDAGVFVVASELKASSDLEPYQRERLEELLDWFNRHLPVPNRFARPGQNRVLSWFKPSATPALDRMWELVAILKDAGEPVELLKTDDPGVILEEDEYQVLAQPYRQNRKIPR